MTLGYSKYYHWGGETNFESKILSGEKLHTIRQDVKGRWKTGNSIQHVTGNRTKQRNQFANGVCTGTENIVIVFNSLGKIESVKVEGKEINNWELIAKNDGLSILDFERWFFLSATSFVFKGKIIHWANLIYAGV